MKTFSEYTVDSTDILVESIGIVDGQLVFDYNKIKADDDEISSKFGKNTKGEKFAPYVKTTDTIAKHKVRAVYSVKGINKTKILKTLKSHNAGLSMKNDDYKQFINRTAMYIDFKFIRKNDIQTIIAPSSSSIIITDLLENLANRNPKLTVINKAFEKNKPKDVQIDYDHPKINDKSIEYLKLELDKAKKNGFFAMKEIKRAQMRKFIKNIMKLTPDVSLQHAIEGKNVVLIDDIISTGTTTTDMIRIIEMYSPNELTAITIFKT